MLKNPRNFRVDPTLLLIVETDASKKAIGAALIQEVKTEEVIQRRLIYTASRSLKSAETRYSNIRRELLGVSFPLRKFRKFLMGNHFLVRTDHRPLDGLFKKAITSIENEDLRDLVSGLTDIPLTLNTCLENQNLFLIGSPETVWTSSTLALTFERVNLESFMKCSPETIGDDSFQRASDILCCICFTG